MTKQDAADRFSTHSHRLVTLVSYLLILVVGLRRRYDLAGLYSIELLIILLGLFTLLFASEPLLWRKYRSYHWIYFVLQMIIVQFIGIFQEYQDTWALLYIVLGFQAASHCTRKAALAWFSVFAAALLATLLAEFGLVSGPGRALAYGVIGMLIISYDIQYSQHEDALAETKLLVAELQEANQRLIEYAAQAEELAALRERNRMVQELYDSVGQKVFAIQLAAEATNMMLNQKAQPAMERINDLQVQTQAALSQMRQLIDQWKPE
jgi:signal transduction histidine kinase